MKKLWILILAIALLCGCNSSDPNEAADATEQPTETIRETLRETQPPVADITNADLQVIDYGSYSGKFVEDGTDEKVEKVAAILVKNTTEQFIEYGTITADFGGKSAVFEISGLPAGKAVWALERNRLTVEETDTFTYLDQVTSQGSDVVTSDERISLECYDGSVSVTNNSDIGITSVRLYYKTIHTDGNYLGGITYTVVIENLAPGKTEEIQAGHYLAEGSEIVRMDCVEQ